MTTIDTHATGTAGLSGDGGTVTVAPDTVSTDGFVAWITSTDHKRVGRLFLGSSAVGALGVAVLGVLLGLDRTVSDRSILGSDVVPQLFAAFRIGLVFAVVVPALLGLAIAVVPLQVGARSVAFPRLAATGFWLWLVGLVLVTITISANGGPGGGNRRMVEGFLVAHVVLLLGLFAGAVPVATTVLTTRAPGMNMRRVPPYSFASLIGALVLVVGLPVLAGALILHFVDYRYGGSAFGSSKVMWDHIGFGYTQPLTFGFAVAAFGIAIDGLATSTGRRLPMRGTAFLGFGLVAIGTLGGITQFSADLRRNLLDLSFGTALSDIVPFALFQLLPILGALIVFAVGGLALSKGKPQASPGAVLGMLGSLLILAAMLANALYHVGDARLGGTVFEEGTRLFLGYGVVLAVLGGVAHWAPKLWGRTLPAKTIIPLGLLGFVATAVAALPYLIAGFAKQPADAVVFAYSGPKGLWNALSMIGHALDAADRARLHRRRRRHVHRRG
ncbi:MAG: cbb3-type cytochrome c oxidase subunit I [Ilumatobacteraceae bacterium]